MSLCSYSALPAWLTTIMILCVHPSRYSILGLWRDSSFLWSKLEVYRYRKASSVKGKKPEVHQTFLGGSCPVHALATGNEDGLMEWLLLQHPERKDCCALKWMWQRDVTDSGIENNLFDTSWLKSYKWVFLTKKGNKHVWLSSLNYLKGSWGRTA